MTNDRANGSQAANGQFAIEAFGPREVPAAKSIGAVRRGRLQSLAAEKSRQQNQTPGPVQRNLEAVQTATLDLRRMDTDDELRAQIEQIDKKLRAITDSTSFTEAFVSIEMQKSVTGMVQAQFDRLIADLKADRREKRRSRAFGALAFAALLMLAGEMHSQMVTRAVDAVPTTLRFAQAHLNELWSWLLLTF